MSDEWENYFLFHLYSTFHHGTKVAYIKFPGSLPSSQWSDPNLLRVSKFAALCVLRPCLGLLWFLYIGKLWQMCDTEMQVTVIVKCQHWSKIIERSCSHSRTHTPWRWSGRSSQGIPLNVNRKQVYFPLHSTQTPQPPISYISRRPRKTKHQKLRASVVVLLFFCWWF